MGVLQKHALKLLYYYVRDIWLKVKCGMEKYRIGKGQPIRRQRGACPGVPCVLR
jgi:hypothetical protein